MTENKELFERLSAINVNEHTEKKSGLTYLSWAWAWAEFKKACPDATYKVWRDPATHLPYAYDQNTGYVVFTSVTVCGETHEMWLPVMDGANKAQKAENYTYSTRNADKECVAATMFDANKAIMRCLVKNLAMFGLGLYIYAGEDLPEEDQKEEAAAKELKRAMASSLTAFIALNDDTATRQAFEDSGIITGNEGEAGLRDLVKQANSKEVLVAIYRRAKELAKKRHDAANKEQK